MSLRALEANVWRIIMHWDSRSNSAFKCNFFFYFWNFTFKCLTKKEGKKVAEHDTADFYAIVSGKQYLSHIIHETDEDKVE